MLNYKLTFIDLSDEEKLEEFLEGISKTFPFNDIFEGKKPFDLKPHYHTDYESRLFLDGCATFIINGEPVECSRGSYIEIYPNVVHSFEYNGEGDLKVLRFFKENETWEATFIE